MTTEVNLTGLSNYFNETVIGVEGTGWLIGIGVVFITVVLLTREVERMGTLMLPVAMGWHLVGLKQSPIFLMITTIVFIINSSSIEILGNVLKSVSEGTSTPKAVREAIAEKREKDRVKAQRKAIQQEGLRLKMAKLFGK